LAGLPSLATSYLIFSLISSSQSILENTVIQTDYQFQHPLITPTNQLTEIQQILAQINDMMTEISNKFNNYVSFSVAYDETSHLISELKEHMPQPNATFKGISSVLKSLLKIIPHRALQNYLNIHREFLEYCHTVVNIHFMWIQIVL
ncbi:unnamed protein product, partial [Rotaria magnacalcarata]